VAGRRLTPSYLDGDGEGDGLRAGVTVCAELAAVDAVFDGGMTSAPGPWFAKYSASGTTIMPTITARMNVTAPHSRRTKAQFTRGRV
jgi:hypothetical protein